jgi:DNA-binding MarR family transcriptional regulator
MPQDAASAYRLTTSFPYLVRRVGLRIGELFDRAASPLGVDVSMYRVLAALAEEDGQRLGRLSDMTTIEVSTLSRLVGTMTRKALVTRQRPKANGRIVEIRLTARGRSLVAQLIPIALKCESVAITGLDGGEIALLKRQLDLAFHNLDVMDAELAAREENTAKPAPASHTKRAAQRNVR